MLNSFWAVKTCFLYIILSLKVNLILSFWLVMLLMLLMLLMHWCCWCCWLSDFLVAQNVENVEKAASRWRCSFELFKFCFVCSNWITVVFWGNSWVQLTIAQVYQCFPYNLQQCPAKVFFEKSYCLSVLQLYAFPSLIYIGSHAPEL